MPTPKQPLRSDPLAEALRQVEAVQRELEEAQRELERSQREIEGSQRKIERTKREREATERELEETQRKLAEARKKLREMQGKLKTALRELEEWRRGHRCRGKRRKRAGPAPGETPKKPGRKEGHPGAGRPKPDKADRTEHCTLADCPDCHDEVERTGRARETLVEEVIPARREVVAYWEYEYVCAGCGKVHWSRLPVELGPAPKVGVEAQRMMVSLRFEYRLSLGLIVKFFQRELEFKISKGGVSQILTRNARRTKPAYQEIQQRAQEQAIVHMDETGHRESGLTFWLWIVCDPSFSLFHIDASRGHKVVWMLLGIAWAGIVVCDFMGAYHAARLCLQLCWAHLLRDARKAAELAPSAATREFNETLKGIYRAGLEAQATQDPEARNAVWGALGEIVGNQDLRSVPDVRRLQDRIDAHVVELLRFLDNPALEATNNRAERDQRFAVLLRAVALCTRSAVGSETYAHWLSVTQTLAKQGLSVSDWFRPALAAYHGQKPPPSIFNKLKLRSLPVSTGPPGN